MRISHNMPAAGAVRYTVIHGNSMAKLSEKLSTGFRINRSSDNAAGLTISEKMRGQMRGLDKALGNVQDGSSLIQTADGALNEVHEILQRMREISVQSANDTNTDSDRENLDKEYFHLKTEIDRIGRDTEFNTLKLFDGSFSGSRQVIGRTESSQAGTPIRKANVLMYFDFSTITDGTEFVINDGTTDHYFEFDSDGTLNNAAYTSIAFLPNSTGSGKADLLKAALQATGKFTVSHYQSGAGEAQRKVLITSTASIAGQDLAVTYQGAPGKDLMLQVGPNSDQSIGVSISALSSAALDIDSVSISTGAGAEESIGKTDTAVQTVSVMRSNLGAAQNRLEHISANLSQYMENLTDSESRIRDTDMADTMVMFAKENILQQMGQSVLAQTARQPEQILTLLN